MQGGLTLRLFDGVRIIGVNGGSKDVVGLLGIAQRPPSLGADGRVTGVKFIRNRLGEPDASGRRSPVPIEGSEFIVPADTVIPAVAS